MDFSSIPRALESLQRRQPPLDEETVLRPTRALVANPSADVFLSSIASLVSSTSSRWEPLAVGLYVATEALTQHGKALAASSSSSSTPDAAPSVYLEGPRVPSTRDEGTPLESVVPVLDTNQALVLCQTLHDVALRHLEHDEPRVRTLVAKAVGAYAKLTVELDDALPHNRQALHDRLVQSIRTHIQQGRDEQPDPQNDPHTNTPDDGDDDGDRSPKYSKSSTGALDDTTGWRALETNWQCLASLIRALGPAYVVHFGVPQTVLDDCQYSCIEHVNRHVRAAGISVLEQWLYAAAAGSPVQQALLTESDGVLRKTCRVVLKHGLADNWSQVRMAASVLCRVLFTTLQALQAPADDLYPVLLPRMCLNRFYLAQGVKLYSHETWKLVFVDSGVSLVAANLPAVCRYYVQMCDADNHVVREAACQAVAELAIRLGSDPNHHDELLPHMDLLLQALLMCFHDESWPVRDEACLACGLLCKAYPESCRPELGKLWERWTGQLTDQIWSVREDAAVALGDALEAYGADFLQELLALVDKLLPSARSQSAMTPTEYKARQNDAAAHTDSQLYSCGSLAPKLRKGGAGRIGCSSCDVNREKSPWEATDGCVYLIRELVVRCASPESPTPLADEILLPMLRELADVCRVQHFPQSDDLRTTLWRNLPGMAEALGKQRFKRLYLDVFQNLLFSSLDARSSSQLSQHAAGQCAEELADLVGRTIFRARLEDDQRDTLDRVLRERAAIPAGPADGAVFSPFGPPGLLDHIHKGTVHPGVAGMTRGTAP
jgi:hypothetical protein